MAHTGSAGTLSFEMAPRLRLPLSVSDRRLILMGCDLAAANGALLVVLTLRVTYGAGWTVIGTHPVWFILLSVVWLAIGHAFDVYDPHITGRFPATVPRLIKAGALAGLIYLGIPFLPPSLPNSRLTLMLFPVAVVTFLVAGRGLFSLALTQPFCYRRVVILGTGRAGQMIAHSLSECNDATCEVVGFVDDHWAPNEAVTFLQNTDDRPIHAPPKQESSFRVLGDRRALLDIVTRCRVNTIVLANSQVADRELVEALVSCLERGVELLPMSALYEQLTGRIPLECIRDDWYVALPVHHPGTRGLYPLMKRLIDIVVGLIGLIALAVVAPVIALATRLDSCGPFLYCQSRVGKGGRVFKLYKFRSMIPDAEQGRAVWAQANDPRVTRIGRVLRATHIDELPQFINVLRGEMSLVGPRPERPQFVAELSAQIAFYRVRLSVKPGLIGWGQVKQGYSASTEDAFRKLQYDLYWIKHQSFWLDTVIVLKALGAMLTMGGR